MRKKKKNEDNFLPSNLIRHHFRLPVIISGLPANPDKTSMGKMLFDRD